MPQAPDTRRTELLDAVVAHLAEHGIAGLSLRPLAKALGQSTTCSPTTSRTRAACSPPSSTTSTNRNARRCSEWASQAPPSSPGAGILGFWHWQIRPEALPLLRLNYEIFGLLSSGRISDHHPRA